MSESPLFFSKLYDETMAQLCEARDLIGRRMGADASLPIPVRLAYSRETMRLSTRLTSVMAWLLMQRAVIEGEMSAADAAKDEHRLAGRDLCLEGACAEHDELPAALRALLDQSHGLYQRVARLDDMVASQAG